MNNKIKGICIFILGMLVSGISVYAVTTLYKASEVSYDNTNSGSSFTEVQSAIDELYAKINVGDATAEDILSGKTALVQGKLITGTYAVNTKDVYMIFYSYYMVDDWARCLFIYKNNELYAQIGQANTTQTTDIVTVTLADTYASKLVFNVSGYWNGTYVNAGYTETHAWGTSTQMPYLIYGKKGQIQAYGVFIPA